ncbi:MFS transporter [uncultured Algibacter sp.]|uniref:MFS transporter n=1 Tax=uncultured Algibacter sp. TaxID=298659 RepID=UPI00263699FD|nr:MFS transporter [uncultured Algibacter sp.]
MQNNGDNSKWNKPYTFLISFIVALGGFLFGFNSAVISEAIEGITMCFDKTNEMLGLGFFNSLISCSVTQIFSWELSNLRPTNTFVIYGVLSLSAVLFVHKFVIETKGKTLEVVEQLLVKS